MPIGAVLSRCALAYIDELLAHTSVHRHKSLQFTFQRLIAVCGKAPSTVAGHAAHVLLSSFGFFAINAPAKKFIDENTATQLLSLIVLFSSEDHPGRSDTELRGARVIFESICLEIVKRLQEIDEAETANVIRNFLKRVINYFEPSQSVALLSQISSNPAIRRFLEPLFSQFVTLNVGSGKCSLRTCTLIEVICNYLNTEAPKEIAHPNCDPYSVVEFLQQSQAQTDKNFEFTQALIFCLLARKRGTSVELTVEKMSEQLGSIISTKICDPQPVLAMLNNVSRNALTRVLCRHGASITQNAESIDDAFKENDINEDLLSPHSVGTAILFVVESLNHGNVQRHASFERAGPAIAELSTADMWDGKVLAASINRINPRLQWIEAFRELDTPALRLDRSSLQFLSDVIYEAFPAGSFPVKFLYNNWKNIDAQLSWIQRAIENSDIFCFFAFAHTNVVQSTLNLKMLPDENDRSVANWCCLDLTVCLLNLSTRETAQKIVQQILDLGISYCPDVVLLALIQAPLPWTTFRMEAFKSILPKLIMQNSNAIPILNLAWNTDPASLKQMHSFILNALASLYAPDDQQRLTKILDIAHELKPAGLSELLALSGRHLPFVVDLACLASKRDYLKIEKWLEDKFRVNGDNVVNSVLSLVQRRYKRAQLVVAYSGPPTPADPIVFLLRFVNQHGNPQLRQQFPTIFQVMKENSGRSSSVSSAGGRSSVQIPPVFGGGPPGQDARGIQRVTAYPPTNQQPPLNFPGAAQSGHMMAQPPQAAGGGMNLLMGMSPFGTGSRDLLKCVQPAAPPPPSMSPSNQMLRSSIPPLPQRQNSSGGWHTGVRPIGPGTPSTHIDFRSQLPPTTPAPDFMQRGGPLPSTTPQHLNDDLSNMAFPEDVQEEANSYFEKIYSQTSAMSVADLIQQLKAFKNSNNIREQKVLACVVKNLFEEYRFFLDYPERELRTTAEVYGGIIREGIIGSVQFATAVRKVIESLQADPNSMLYTFGIVALQNCRVKLSMYPKVCTMIATLENFQKFPQSLKDYVIAGVKGEQPPDAGRATPPVWAAAARPSIDPKSTIPANRTGSVLSYTNVDTLVAATEKDGAEVAQPVEAVLDKVAFLFNNLSHSNICPKREEIVHMMAEHGEAFTKWLAQYIVMKRVSIEQNFQPLYNQFVQAIDSPLLDAFIKKETYRNIKILLRTDKRTNAASNYSDRQLLKNLGMWLGSITIARNKPIRLTELDLKSLLLEAYYKGQAELLFVVPFISKILLSCGKTNIFTPSCSWIKSILKVLAELHNEPDLKINLKFEIEVLCKELSVDLTSLPIDGVLKDTEKLVRVTQQLCDLRMLVRPDVPSPVPSQMRVNNENTASPVTETKPSTPQPDANEANVAGNQPETTAAPVTHFAYHDINVLSYDGLIPHVKIQTSLPLFQLHPHAKHLVRPAMTHAIKELIGPVTERALKIAMTVTENMIKKDFAMDPDEKNMKLASFHMMRAMTAGMAMITCRDPLSSTMLGYLTQAFQSSLRTATANPELQKLIDEAALAITNDNVELSTNFIVKTACEKASAEMEKRLDPEYQKRAASRRDGVAFHDEAALALQKRLPPTIATQPGATEKSNLAVYEQFSSRICGFKPTNEETTGEAVAALRPTGIEQAKEMEPFISQIQHFVKEVDQTTQSQPHVSSKAFHAVCMIRDLLSNVVANPRDPSSLINLINRSVEHLLHSYSHDPNPKNQFDIEWARRLRDLFSGVFRLLQTQFQMPDLARRVTAALINIRSDYKWNMDGIEILLKQNLVQTALWDQHLAASMDGGGNLEATVFAQKFIRAIGGTEVSKMAVIKEAFPQTCEQLLKLQQIQSATRVTGIITDTNGTSSTPEPASLPLSATDILPTTRSEDGDLTSKVEMILREWIGVCYTPMAQRNPQEALSQMIQLMHEQGVLATDEKITQFFRLCVEMCVDVSVRILKNESQAATPPTNPLHQNTIVRQRCYYTLDAFVKLMALMIRHSDGAQSHNKINLLKKLLNIVVGVLHMDHEIRRNDFNAMPYHRILISLFNEITGPDPQHLLEPIAWSILEAFGQTLFALQPRRIPGFAFAWLDIVGHRNVIGRLLANTGIAETVDPVKTAATFTQLIICHLKFLAPFLRNIQLPKSIAILYKGTLRVLLVILHDFPELLCEYHYVVCDTIPPNCVQLRNLVLSAYPRNMRLPDPFALNFKQVDSIPEMAIEPKSNLNMVTIIPENIRLPLDEYLNSRSSVDFLSSLPSLLQVSNTPGSKYNTTVMNALVLYVGIRAIENLHNRRQQISILTIAHTSFMDIFQNLAVQLCTEGRYLLFNGVANQLRYPNAHTHYFSCVFLYLFQISDCNAIQEQITRILFERLVALRPHPWGLLITFIELIKNPTYQFWKYEFTKCAPEIERLFQNVANTCVPAQASALPATETKA